MLVEPDSQVASDAVLDRLTALKVGARVHYRAIHPHPYCAERYGLVPESLPIAADIGERTISLRLGRAISDQDLEDVAEALATALTG